MKLLPLRMRRWYKRYFGPKKYITTFAEAADFPVELTDRKCPGCGNYAEPYAPGHAAWCKYSAENNIGLAKLHQTSTYGKHAR